MNPPPLPDDFVKALLAQDSFLTADKLTEHRRRILDRLAAAEAREKKARKVATLTATVCVAIVLAIFAAAFYEVFKINDWPEWGHNLLSLAVILSPVTA